MCESGICYTFYKEEQKDHPDIYTFMYDHAGRLPNDRIPKEEIQDDSDDPKLSQFRIKSVTNKDRHIF